MISKIKALWKEFVKGWIVDYSPDEKKRRQDQLGEYHKAIKRITDDIKNAKYLHELQLIKNDIHDFNWKFYIYCFEGFAEMVELLEKDRSEKIDVIQNLSTV